MEKSEVTPAPKSLARTPQVILVLSVLLTLALYSFPILNSFAYPFILLSTLAHEMSHGLFALTVGGSFHSFKMFSDASGVAQISLPASALRQAWVAAGGLLGPSIFAALFFVLGKKPKSARLSLTLLGALLIVCEFVFVRNLFGWAFVGAVAALFLYLGQQKSNFWAQTVLVFFSTQLSLSVFSRSDYLFTEFAQTSQGLMLSDVAQMADALWLPYWFWGAACGLFSLSILFFGLWIFLRK